MAAGPMIHSVRGVLFDLDGVLVDSKKAWFEVLERCRRVLGYPPIGYPAFAATFGQGTHADQELFFPRHAVDAIDALYAETFLTLLDEVQALEGAQTVLAALHDRGMRLGVVTNSPRRLAEAVLHHKGLDLHLDALAAAGEAPDKPAPELIWLALSRLGLQSAEALYVGDSEADRAAARAAGVPLAGLGIEGDFSLGSLLDLFDLFADDH